MTLPAAFTERPLTRLALICSASVMVAVMAPMLLPRSGLNAGQLLAALLLVVAVVGASATGPQSLLLGAAALALLATIVGSEPTATLSARDLAVGLMPCVIPLAAAAVLPVPWPAALATTGGLVAGPLRMLVYDPFLDPACAGCAPGQLVVRAMPDLAALLFPVGIGIAIIGVGWGLARGPWEVSGILISLIAFGFDWARSEAMVVGCLLGGLAVGRRAVASYRRRAKLNELVRSIEDGQDLAQEGVTQLVDSEDAVTQLVLENRQLTRRLAAQVEVVTEARASVVRVAAAERRAMERDLHDGVQQQILSLGLDLRTAISSASGDHRSRLEAALAQVFASLEDVREVTRGAFPSLLATRGLVAAADHLKRRHHGNIEFDVADERLDESVERAVYFLFEDAARRGARRVSVIRSDELLVVVEGVSPPRVLLYDIVGALGGSLTAHEDRLEAVIPCA